MSWEGNRRASKKGMAERPGLGRGGNGKAAVSVTIRKPNRPDRRSPPSVPQSEVPLQKG